MRLLIGSTGWGQKTINGMNLDDCDDSCGILWSNIAVYP